MKGWLHATSSGGTDARMCGCAGGQAGGDDGTHPPPALPLCLHPADTRRYRIESGGAPQSEIIQFPRHQL